MPDQDKCTRGSEWRKWDLHVHTPASFHWNGGKHFSEMNPTEKQASLKMIVDQMELSDVAVFGIMDYWTFDGYKELMGFLKGNPGIKCSKCILPGLELRVQAPTNFRLNIHVLLSNDLTEQQLADFKAQLKISDPDKDRSLSDEGLVDYAKKIGKDKAKEQGFNDEDLKENGKLFELGCKTAEITKESLKEAFRQIPEDKGIVILPYDTSNGISKLDWKTQPAADIWFMQLADIFESRDLDNIDLFLGKTTEKNKDVIDNFQKTIGKVKPVISGSDAHKIPDYGCFPNKKITWIKANPTFDGLNHVIIEPLNRSFIGETPDKLITVKNNMTKYISHLEISKLPGSKLDENWFDNKIDFNHDLIAIIGSKGSGKSALAEIIGLLGFTKNANNFSFLIDKKFREAKNNKAKNFTATLTWEKAEMVYSRALDEKASPDDAEMIKYIPQNYLEVICNEIEGGEKSEFNLELENVIFSHVSSTNRLGKHCMKDLISYKTGEVRQTITLLKDVLSQINSYIIDLERRGAKEHKQSIENLLRLKQEQLAAIELLKPKEIKKPDTDADKQKELLEISKAIEAVKTEIQGLEEQIASKAKEQEQLTKQITSTNKLLTKIANFQRQYEVFKTDCLAEIAIINMNIDDLVALVLKTEPLNSKLTELTKDKEELDAALDSKNEDSLLYKRNEAATKFAELRQKLDGPSQEFEAYLAELKIWEDKKAGIVGKEDSPETIKYYEKAIKDLENVPSDLIKQKEARMQKVGEIYDEISKLVDIYKDLYKPVQDFIRQHPLATNKFNLNFDVSIVSVDFKQKFFDRVNQRVAGSFCGSSEGERLIDSTLEQFNFNDKTSTCAFIEKIMALLAKDSRSANATEVSITNQLKKGHSIASLYDYIFSLDYLEPRYALTFNDKELNQLSPGEKGTLLLIFYLLIDKSDIPLVIDQPEENLDNETVYLVLVPCIKEAKKRRQIIIVTHNPNLAVVCDAEQIIHCTLDKTDKNRVIYKCGAIENQDIKNKIINILEGTEPAFINRDSKYMILE
jgi:ABC-type lipoprotein export system ATPase subunit